MLHLWGILNASDMHGLILREKLRSSYSYGAAQRTRAR